MAVISKDLGAVTAYAAAVNRGYTGTKEEFETLMASYATVAQQAAESAQSAEQSAQSASGSATDAQTAQGTAQQAATDAQTAQASAQGYAQSAQQSAQSASQYAQSAESAKNTAVSTVDGFAAGAQQALDSVNQAGNNWKSLAQAKALDSEAYALGTRDGEDVGTQDETYHNNAKYYAEQGGASAQTATDAAQTATMKAGEAQASASSAAESARTLTIDATLTQSGQAADAKATGDIKNSLNGTEAVLLKDRQLYKGFLSANTINYNTNAYFAVIDVDSGQKITVGADTTATNIAVLKSFTYGEVPVFSEAEGFTGRIVIPVNQTREYIIPSDGKYLIVLMENLGISLAPKSFLIEKYDISRSVPDNYNDIYSQFDYKAAIKKPTNFTYQTQNGVTFSVDTLGNQSVIGTPTISMVWYSASFLQKENAKAVLTGKPSGSGSKYWLRLQESSDGENFTLVDSDNQTNSNDSHFNLESGKYYRLAFGITSNAIGSALNLLFKSMLFAGGYIEETKQDNGEEDELTDIIIPYNVDTMEGHENNIYFDTLSRYDGMENQYLIQGITHGMYRNDFCTRFTPTASDTTFYLNVIRLNKETAKVKEQKRVYFNVNHPLQSNLTKNVMIMGDSLTDSDIVPQECYRMLTADADCTINHVGTLGNTGSENEGRSSWRWLDYISPSGTYRTNYDNPFWDTTNNRLDFKKYCQTNGYSGLDYVLINLGTNDIMTMNVVDSPEGYAEVIERAKTFLTALLSEDYGYPNCKVAIALLGIGPYYSARIYENANLFRKKFNMLNVAYLYAFDNGAWNENVTCFALGSSTNRKYGYGYTETAISARFPQPTLQEDDLGIHPSTEGYLSWADAYYCKIRTWLTEDSQ